MIVKVDKDKCISCGLCVSICPDAFDLGKDGKAYVKNQKGCEKCDCKEAASSCPVQAIGFK